MALIQDAWSFFIDRGGTFTDCIGLSPTGEVRVTKVLSSDEAPLEGIRALLRLSPNETIPPSVVRMGTTVATNALLERRGAPTVLAITRGFKDALTIGTQARPDLFALEIPAPRGLAGAVVELDLRLDADGFNLLAPQADLQVFEELKLMDELEGLVARGFESLAVVVLHAYKNGAPEQAVAEIALKAGFKNVSTSHEVAPEIGLVGRGDTTLVDAYLTPLLRDYVRTLESALPGSRLLIMQSSGGLVKAGDFRGRNAVLSGPAGGVVAAAHVAREADAIPAIAFDMGGTSTDVTRIGDELERNYETEVADIRLRAPMMDIHTVAAGGGSICRWDGVRLSVGPDSAGANPGPLCYGRPEAVHLALTDVNLVLGRIRDERFPFSLHPQRPRAALQAIADQAPALSSPEAVAEGFVEVANEAMAQAIRQVTVARGHDVREHALVVFGGAGGQHASALARRLNIDTVLFPPFSGVLSAYGMALAKLDWHAVQDAGRKDLGHGLEGLESSFQQMEAKGRQALYGQGLVDEDRLETFRRLDLRYAGTETTLTIDAAPEDTPAHLRHRFEDEHRRTFGYARAGRVIEVVNARVELRGRVEAPELVEPSQQDALHTLEAAVFFGGQWINVPVLAREALGPADTVEGPVLILEATGTLWVEPGFSVRGGAILRMTRSSSEAPPARRIDYHAADPVLLEVYNHRFMAIAERMGTILRRTAQSVNIRERLDFSCALFDGAGELVANAPHIPVHLGAMSESVKAIVRQHPGMEKGDVYVTNDPSQGGSHLPDITVVTPVFGPEGRRLFFTASRGHHEDVGGITPGSMPPFSRLLSEEGVVLKGLRLVHRGQYEPSLVEAVLRSGEHPARKPEDNLADLEAQIAANEAGAQLLAELWARVGAAEVTAYMGFVQADAARRVRAALGQLQPGNYSFEDALDGGAPVRVTLHVLQDQIRIDFSGTSPWLSSNLNAPRAVTVAAVLYVIRALVGESVPLNSGCFEPVELIVAKNSLLDPPPTAAVAGGNVETSQRVVDVLLGALGRAAASQGTMNNLSFGSRDFGYYETIAGGAGATPFAEGRSGVHTHMTNTRITDAEVLESRFPVRLVRFGLNLGSGGAGKHPGGDGVIREVEALVPLTFSILSERRDRAPFGLAGGAPGAPGQNLVDGRPVPAKASFRVEPGQRVRIETPGGGGFGDPET